WGAPFRATRLKGDAERYEQAAEQNRIRQRVGRRVEPAAIRVERRERTPQRIGGALVQLARDRFEQPDVRQTAKRALRRTGAQDLVVLLEQPRLRALRNLAAVRADRFDERRLDREVEPRRQR